MLVDVSITTIDLSPGLLADAARTAEAAGFDGVRVYDHLSGTSFGGRGAFDVWSAITVVALATERVTVGPLVLNAPMRHPAHVAVAAATAQAVSGGRLALGLGAGAGPGDPYAAELSMLGLPLLDAATRRALVVDTIGYLRALWAGEPAYRGTHHRFDGPDGVAAADPAPPIVVGVNGPRLAAQAGAVADGVNVHDWQADLDGVVAVARAAAGDRPFEVSLEGPLDDAWLDPDGEPRARARALGVDRLILRWAPALGVGALDRAVR